MIGAKSGNRITGEKPELAVFPGELSGARRGEWCSAAVAEPSGPTAAEARVRRSGSSWWRHPLWPVPARRCLRRDHHSRLRHVQCISAPPVPAEFVDPGLTGETVRAATQSEIGSHRRTQQSSHLSHQKLRSRRSRTGNDPRGEVIFCDQPIGSSPEWGIPRPKWACSEAH
jgi:hypothetical protein